MQGDLVK